MFEILGGSFPGGWTLLRRHPIPTAAFLALALLGALFELSLKGQTQPLGARLGGLQACSSLVFFFAVASAARTIRPEYRMNALEFLAFLWWALLTTVMSIAGFVLFVVPGCWLAGKLWPAAYAWVLGSRDPLADSWHATTDAFWPTLALNVAYTALSFGVTFGSAFAIGLVTTASPALGISALLVATAIGCWFAYVTALGLLRWTSVLLPTARMTL